MKIGAFSEKTGISAYTLRYYEKKGLLHVNYDHAGRRDYQEADIEWVKFIKRLKDTGMLLRDIRHYSDLRYQGDETMRERKELLSEHRKVVLAEQKKWADYLENLDRKITYYETEIEFLGEEYGKKDGTVPKCI
ncbi:MAG: MerR family transcriptional regulator [Faecalicatena sp.]|nr:MerR family transcriptional regulator [Faecalicatena sp.]MCI6466789.1 MerR family transcriptional regulator [Faecalicatena sp.]MDY5620582.1 MerR family transcriptional regulator [Lachnospiraceae bacterium]